MLFELGFQRGSENDLDYWWEVCGFTLWNVRWFKMGGLHLCFYCAN